MLAAVRRQFAAWEVTREYAWIKSFHKLIESRRITSMDNTLVNQELELAARRTLTRISGSEDTLKPLYLQPDRALFLAENLHIILKVYTAALTLWDHELTDFLLEGYNGIENNEETKQLLSLYRLLRHLGEIPWLLERGFKALAARNIIALKESLNGD